MAIPVAAPGASSTVPRVKDTFWRRTVRFSTANTRRSSASCELWPAWLKTSYHLSIPICHIFTPFARPAHGDFGWHHSRCDHATSRSGYAAAGLQWCVKLGHVAALSPVEPHTRRPHRPHVASQRAPCDTYHGASPG